MSVVLGRSLHGFIFWGLAGVLLGFPQVVDCQNIQLDQVIQIGKEGGNAHGTAIASGTDGSTFVTGHFSGLVDFDPGRGTADRTSAGDYDGFVVKLDADRNLLWVNTFGGPYEEKSNAIALDSEGNVCITGTFERTEVNEALDKGAGETGDDKGYFPLVGYDLFIMKLNSVGEEQWTRRFSPDARGDAEGWGVAVDSADSILVAGNFEGSMDLDPGDGVQIVDSSYSADLLVVKLDPMGNYVWARTVEPLENGDVTGRDIAVDNAGNVCIVGWFEGRVDLDPGAQEAIFESAGGADILIQKLDSNGDFVWARTFGGASHDNGMGIAVDRDGAVCTTGSFHGTVDFEAGPGETILSSVGPELPDEEAPSTLFVHKICSDGGFAWARAADSPRSIEDAGDNGGHDIATDEAGNLYITGGFYSAVDLDPGEGTYEVSSASWYNFFVQKLNKNGQFEWARHVGTNGASIQSYGIAVGATENVQLTGEYAGLLDFDPGETGYRMGGSGPNVFVNWLDTAGDFVGAGRMGGRHESVSVQNVIADDVGNTFITGILWKSSDFQWDVDELGYRLPSKRTAYVSKYAPDGELTWTQELSGGGFESGIDIALDGGGNLYQVGHFSSTVDFDSGPGIVERTSIRDWDYFLRKLDADGNLLWVQTLTGEEIEVRTDSLYPSSTGLAIATDEEGYVYLTGAFEAVIDIDPGAGEDLLSTPGWNAAYVAKLSPLGNLVWARALGSDDGVAAGNKIGTDAVGNVYVMGHFSDTIDFDPDSGEDIRTSQSVYDIFIQKFDPDGHHLWVRTVGDDPPWETGGIGAVNAQDFAVDCHGNVHTVGRFYGEIDFDPSDDFLRLAGGRNGLTFVQKLDTDGQLIWAKGFGGEDITSGYGISVDYYGSVYTTGTGRSRVDLDPGPGESVFDIAGNGGVFIQKLDAAGEYVWGRVAAAHDSASEGSAIAVNASGRVHVAGHFVDDLEFEDGEETTTLRSTGGEDTFVASYSQPGFETIPEPCQPALGGEAALLESVAITLSRAFDLVDSNGGGSLSWDEVRAEIPGITQQHVDAIDANGDGLLVEGELDTFIPAGEGEGEGEEPAPGCPLDGGRVAKHISDALGDILLFGSSAIVLLIGGWRKAL